MRRLIPAVALLLIAAPVGAQSIYNAAGLGFPSEPVDGRERALGSFGIGLWGSSLQPRDPGSTGMMVMPTAMFVAQPSWTTFDRNSEETGSFQGNRFPLIGVAYPLLNGMFSLTFGSFLDQHYDSQRDASISLPDTTLAATDLFEQEGAVSHLTVGYSRRVLPGAAVGVNVGRYAGSLVRRLSRDFGGITSISSIDSYQAGGFWSYAGTSVTGGFAADLTSVARVSGSVTWSSALDANASDDTEAASGSFDLPIQYRIGASAVLAPGLRIAASMVRADWSGIADDLANATTVGGTGGFGVGIELSRARLLGREAPLRFGYKKIDLPFAFGPTAASETSWAGGFGLTLSQTNNLVLAAADLAVERGTRSDSLLKESFWRATLSLRVSGY